MVDNQAVCWDSRAFPAQEVQDVGKVPDLPRSPLPSFLWVRGDLGTVAIRSPLRACGSPVGLLGSSCAICSWGGGASTALSPAGRTSPCRPMGPFQQACPWEWAGWPLLPWCQHCGPLQQLQAPPAPTPMFCSVVFFSVPRWRVSSRRRSRPCDFPASGDQPWKRSLGPYSSAREASRGRGEPCLVGRTGDVQDSLVSVSEAPARRPPFSSPEIMVPIKGTP